jgi:hypothetical protein
MRIGWSQFSSSRPTVGDGCAARVMPLLAMATSRAIDTEPLIGQATYRFAAGDRITISVLGQSDSDDFPPDSAGEMPFDPTSISGMTVRETELEITKRLPGGCLCHPSVSAPCRSPSIRSSRLC